MCRVSRLGLVVLFLLLSLQSSIIIIIIIIILLTDPDHRPVLSARPGRTRSHLTTRVGMATMAALAPSLAALSPSLSLNHTRCSHAI
jgi:hypothetical protein